jgi:predicted GIY-YIG superfamily endonuclease
MNRIVIYALLLQDNCYYIGQTRNLKNRFKQHLEGNGEGASWTSIHKPIKILEELKTKAVSEAEAMIHENCMTINYMRRYGWRNVRGGNYCDISEQKIESLLAPKFDLNDRNLKAIIPVEHIYKNNRDWLIYVLKLENGCYYVGATSNLQEAIKKHIKGKSAEWTRLHKFIGIIDLIPNTDEGDGYPKPFQNQVTIKLMREHGWEKVRGGDFNLTGRDSHKNMVVKKTALIKDCNAASLQA